MVQPIGYEECSVKATWIQADEFEGFDEDIAWDHISVWLE
jgi:hypothetical protein